jgi:serine/threonine protein kinase
MAVKTVGDFLSLLEKSKLLDSDRMTRARGLVHAGDDPLTAAKNIARHGIITRWQAGLLLAGRSSFYLGKYRLLQLLGRGGMGSVFLAEHVTMNRRVALKTISRKVGKDPASLQRFLAEARAVAALDHPNIVQAYSVDNEGDRYYLVMEYVEGTDLQHLVEINGPLECERAVDYIRQAADGLEHAHQRNMIHCDIKPSNLLVNQQGVVKILDMGLAKLSDSDQSSSDSHPENVLGSVDYLSPEQALSSPSLDGRADIYSLGCTFYFLLTGHPPFPEGSLHERILKHQTQQPQSIREQRADVPNELIEFCMKMMAKEPGDRFQTSAEVSQWLSEWRPSSPKLLRALPLPSTDAEDSSAGLIFEPDYGKDSSGSNPLDLLSLAKLPDFAAMEATATPLPPSPSGPKAKLGKRGIWPPTPAVMTSILIGVAAIVILALIILLLWPNSNNPSKDSKSNPVARSSEPKKEAVASSQAQKQETPPVQQAATNSTAPPPVEAAPPKPTENKKAEPPPPPPPTATTQSTSPPKESGNPPAQPQETPPPPPSPPEPSSPVEPLQGFAPAIDLPPPANGESDPMTLGKVYLPPKTSLQVSLIGGRESFGDDNVRYAIRSDQMNGISSWTIRASANSSVLVSPTDIVRLTLDNDTLNMRWLPFSVPAIIAPLRSCGLDISVGDAHKTVMLSRPQPIEPLVIDLEMDHSPRTLSCPFIPSDTIRLQFISVDGSFPPLEIEPGNIISSKEKMQLKVEDPALPPTELQISFEPKADSITVSVAVLCQLPDARPPGSKKPLRPEYASKVETSVLKRYDQTKANVAKTPANNPRMPTMKAKLKEAEDQVAQLAALSNFFKATNNVAKVNFRVFHLIGDREVDLYITQASSKPESTPTDAKSSEATPPPPPPKVQ